MILAGLAPGFAGLYQINLVIPEGVAAGDEVPLAIEMAKMANDLNDFETIPVK